jgi:hypothetical protein
MLCEGGYDGLPQCALNRELIEDDEWDATMLMQPELPPQYAAPLRTYRWIPARLESTWKSLRNVTWGQKFHAQLELDFPGAPFSPSMRRMSDILSMPMTALYALECLNDNLDWTKKDVLTIHVCPVLFIRLLVNIRTDDRCAFEGALQRDLLREYSSPIARSKNGQGM